MLQKNRLAPPRDHATGTPTSASASRPVATRPFVSAEDFDRTGILAGVDPCESRYWWTADPEPAATA
jgi:hypothetical protein